MISTLRSVGISVFSNWKPSRGPTSLIRTRSGSSNGNRAGVPTYSWGGTVLIR